MFGVVQLLMAHASFRLQRLTAARAARRPGRSPGWHWNAAGALEAGRAGPSLGRLGRLWAVESRPTTRSDADRREIFPLVSAASGAWIRPPPWSPRRSCRCAACAQIPSPGHEASDAQKLGRPADLPEGIPHSDPCAELRDVGRRWRRGLPAGGRAVGLRQVDGMALSSAISAGQPLTGNRRGPR
jgi:hypothetical protein